MPLLGIGPHTAKCNGMFLHNENCLNNKQRLFSRKKKSHGKIGIYFIYFFFLYFINIFAENVGCGCILEPPR